MFDKQIVENIKCLSVCMYVSEIRVYWAAYAAKKVLLRQMPYLRDKTRLAIELVNFFVDLLGNLGKY